MEHKQKQNYLPWIIVAVVVIIFVFYLISSNQNSSNQTTNSVPASNNIPDVVGQQNQVTTTPVPQQKVVPTQNTYTNFELSENPSYLYSKTFNPNKAKVYGVGIGDPESKLVSSIVPQTEYGGWVHTTNGTGYRIVNGTVEEIALNNDGIANLFSEDEIVIKFGQPDQTKASGSSPYITDTYYYINRGLVITYYQTGGIKVNIIGS